MPDSRLPTQPVGTTPEHSSSETWVVYRIWDNGRDDWPVDRVVYVGSTNDLERRKREHHHDGTYPRGERFRFVVAANLATEDEARDEEIRQIVEFLPPGNRMHADKWRDRPWERPT